MHDKDMMDALLDKALKEYSDELPLVKEIQIPNVTGDMARFREAALQKASYRPFKVGNIVRYAAAIACICLLGTGAYMVMRGGTAGLTPLASGMQSPQGTTAKMAVGGQTGAELAAQQPALVSSLQLLPEGGDQQIYDNLESAAGDFPVSVPIVQKGHITGDVVIADSFTVDGNTLNCRTLVYRYLYDDKTITIHCAVAASDVIDRYWQDIAEGQSQEILDCEGYVFYDENMSYAAWFKGDSVYIMLCETDKKEFDQILQLMKWNA